jgi:rubrerythrin
MDGVMERSGVDGYVEFLGTGTRAHGEFRCSACGYGIAIRTELPACPMCGAETWERLEHVASSRTARRRY